MIEPQTQLEFNCLCFDTGNNCAFSDSPERLGMILRGNVKLFSDKSTSHTIPSKTIVSDSTRELSLEITKAADPNLDYTAVFHIRVTFNNVEQNFDIFNGFRLELINHLVSHKMGKIYITRDDFSAHLLAQLYPKVNKLENLLRSYIIKHFSINEGVSSWYDKLLDTQTTRKGIQRKNNEKLFTRQDESGKHIVDTRICLADFDDLGEMIYLNSFGNITSSDLIERINRADELDELRRSVQANIVRYFESFKDVDFQGKWEFLGLTRHKVAHNGFIDFSEFTQANVYLEELISFIEAKDAEKINTKVVKENYVDIDIERRPFIAASNGAIRVISRNELLGELISYRDWSKSIGREFLGLKNFLHNRLGYRGFDINASWDALEALQTEGYIEISSWVDPNMIYPEQKQITILKELPVYSI